MNRLFAFVWVVIVGSNVAHYYSEQAAASYRGAVILAGVAYFVLVFRHDLLGLVFSKEYFLFFLLLAGIPILSMLFSESSFELREYTSRIGFFSVFVVASVLALRADFDRTLTAAAFVIVGVSAALNVYELLIQNNLWSIAPGRSAGFYSNPNISSQALLGYGVFFLTARVGKLTLADLIVMALVIVGVFSTFSRAGILATLVLLTAAMLMRAQRRYIPRIIVSVVATLLFAFLVVSYVVQNVDLSTDATLRIHSLIETWGVGDYEEQRGLTALAFLELAMENPFQGSGSGSIYSMPEGPHNMFLAVMVEYGVFALIVYLVIIIRFILVGRNAGCDLSAMVLLYVVWLVIFSFVSHTVLYTHATIPLMGFMLARAYRAQLQAQPEFRNDLA